MYWFTCPSARPPKCLSTPCLPTAEPGARRFGEWTDGRLIGCPSGSVDSPGTSSEAIPSGQPSPSSQMRPAHSHMPAPQDPQGLEWKRDSSQNLHSIPFEVTGSPTSRGPFPSWGQPLSMSLHPRWLAPPVMPQSLPTPSQGKHWLSVPPAGAQLPPHGPNSWHPHSLARVCLWKRLLQARPAAPPPRAWSKQKEPSITASLKQKRLPPSWLWG